MQVSLETEYEIGLGLDSKKWNRVLDNYLWGDGTIPSEDYGELDEKQLYCIQAIKRSKKRAKI